MYHNQRTDPKISCSQVSCLCRAWALWAAMLSLESKLVSQLLIRKAYFRFYSLLGIWLWASLQGRGTCGAGPQGSKIFIIPYVGSRSSAHARRSACTKY